MPTSSVVVADKPAILQKTAKSISPLKPVVTPAPAQPAPQTSTKNTKNSWPKSAAAVAAEQVLLTANQPDESKVVPQIPGNNLFNKSLPWLLGYVISLFLGRMDLLICDRKLVRLGLLLLLPRVHRPHLRLLLTLRLHHRRGCLPGECLRLDHHPRWVLRLV